MATSLGYSSYQEPLCGNCPENSQRQFNQTMTALVHKNHALWTGNAAGVNKTVRRSAAVLGYGCIVRGQNNVC